MASKFGTMVKELRKKRRYSQLELSLLAEMSSRHLSFLESGRSMPSRAMVLKLSNALQLPHIIINQLMKAAEYSPIYSNLSLDSDELEPFNQAISYMLKNHSPFPAIVIDRHWNIVQNNNAAQWLISAVGLVEKPNLIDLLISSAEMQLIENWQEVALLSLIRLRAEITHVTEDEILSQYTDRLASLDIMQNIDISAMNHNQAIIPIKLNIAGKKLSLFSTIAQFGSIQDINASEMRIELMFPQDKATGDFFISIERWATETR